MPQITLTFFIEIIGTIAFASSGALVGIGRRMDLFGIMVLGVTTAVGGGIIRDVILNLMPPTTFRYPVYMATAALTVLLIFMVIRLRPDIMRTHFFNVYEQVINVLDAIGLGAFTVLGINSAITAGYGEYRFLLVFLGVMTGIGGGVVRDMMAGETPYVMRKHVYATASIIGAIVCVLLWMWELTSLNTAMLIGGGLVILIRMLASYFRWNLPRAM